ncbi:superoxide dismutase [Saccharomonospora sp. CUA-673]|uniref:superoxide dismutase family protein n=1 Tax=Saccharomonospora sp. CUA-673 TaxID=1904969 RepID=UPI00096680F1|nr:superoxide dismutase family protein [Saccharomonospora sp. CUA-673]OLT46340.1 superoxide dismutase [Saccharomonospora sp. CUA-673]
MKRLPAVLALTSAVALVGAGTATAAESAERSHSSKQAAVAFAHGTFGPYTDGATATTYDEELVPSGAHASVFSLSADGPGTTTKLAVRGLVPDRHYGAHVHDHPCGADGADAGPHYQHELDPNQPSTDPEYANPDNEVWLDFTTSAHGNGFAKSHVDWPYDDERRPGSVIIHEHHTSTHPGEAGEAGERLACINVDL